MRSVSELAFDRLLDSVKEAAEVYTGPLGATDARERAECYRHATGALAIAIEGIIEKGDRARPAVAKRAMILMMLLRRGIGTCHDPGLFCWRLQRQR